MEKKRFSPYMTNLLLIHTILFTGKAMTAGEIAKTQQHMTKNQVVRALDGIVSDGHLSVETIPHGRTGKKVYRPTLQFWQDMHVLITKYDEKFWG